MAARRILIVSYVFPPYPGMGGRRWAKFAKHLAKQGCEVDVICAENPFEEVSLWAKDAETNGIRLHRQKRDYPAILSQSPRNIFEKLQYKSALFFLMLFSRGNYYDRSVFWRMRAKRKARELILKHGIRDMIVTGAPFRMMTDLISLKSEFGGLRVSCDLRDLWANNQEAYGISQLPESRRNFESEQELEVLKTADRIFVVVEPMAEYLRKRSPENAEKIFLLDNGYDPDDFPSTPGEVPGNSGKLKLVLTGTLSQGYRYVWLPLLETLARLREEKPEMYARFSFTFYGSTPEEFRKIVQEKNLSVIQTHPPVPVAEVFRIIDEAHLCMFFNYQTQNYVFGIKFYEYITRKRKLALFAEEGQSSEFVRRENLGYTLSPQTMQEGLEKMYQDFLEGRMRAESHFDPSPFSLPSLTEKLLKLLN